jgi:hypothetical protein
MKIYCWNNKNVLLEQLVLRWNIFWVFLENICLAQGNEKSGWLDEDPMIFDLDINKI